MKYNFRVMMYAKSMRDFVTSRWSAIEKASLKECYSFCVTSEEAQPGRFEYYIQEKIEGEWRPVGSPGGFTMEDANKIIKVLKRTDEENSI